MAADRCRRALLSALLAATVLLALDVASAGAFPVPAGRTPAGAGQRAVRMVALTPAPPCPSDDTCVTIPTTSTHGLGGTVEAGPTSDLGPHQWVYLNGYGFTPGNILSIEYCSDTKPLPTPPLCVTKASPGLAQAAYVTQPFATGTFAASFQIEQDSTPTAPIGGTSPTLHESGSFLCDAATPCSIDVIERIPSGAATPENTAVVPVSFSPPTTSCPGAQTVPTESEFGMELVLPAVARASCSTSHPAIAFNEALDGSGALLSLQTGGVTVAFTDDPEASDEQAILKTGNYKLIPVALTANVVAFRAVQLLNGTKYPLFDLNLTPTMAAGLLTGVYGAPHDTDQVKCPDGTCPPTPPCNPPPRTTHTPPSCSLFLQTNYSKGFEAPQQYSPFVRSDSAGSNGLFFAWVCDAPVVPVTVSFPIPTKKHRTKTVTYTATYTETATAAHELEHGFSAPDTQVTKCPTTETYPQPPTGGYGAYKSFDDPTQQAQKMLTYMTQVKSTPPAAFSSMNWAEARYYGLAVASLQNAAGQFVAPSSTSLVKAITDGNPTVNADGTLSPNYKKAETGVYPMASIEYAAVCGNPTSTTKATATKDMLDQLLAVTAATGPDSSQLPEGYVPLPATLVQSAKTEISKDVVGGARTPIQTTTAASACPFVTNATKPKTPTPTTSAKASTTPAKTTTTPSEGSTSSGGGIQVPTASTQTPPSQPSQSAQSSPVTATRSSEPASSVPSTSAPAHSTSPNTGQPNSKKQHKKGTSSLPVFLLALASSGSRVLLSLAALLALLALSLGGLLVFAPSFRRHLASGLRAAGRTASSLVLPTSRQGAVRRRRRTGSRPW